MTSEHNLRRRSIHTQGFAHINPIPAASRIGDLVFSGVITGRDPATRTLPPDLDAQCANVFRHVRAIVEAAGGTTDDIIKMTVWLRDPADRTALNREWTAMFPDAESRPARHVIAASPDGDMAIQCDLIAVLRNPHDQLSSSGRSE